MADYHSLIAKAVSALDLNTEKARRRLYERARSALCSKMHSAYPPFRRSEIAAEEMSLEMAIEAVEADLMREQSAKLATLGTSPLRTGLSVTPSQPANQSGEVRHSRATLWAGILRRTRAQVAAKPYPTITSTVPLPRDALGLPNSWPAPRMGSIITKRISHQVGRRRQTATQNVNVRDTAEPLWHREARTLVCVLARGDAGRNRREQCESNPLRERTWPDPSANVHLLPALTPQS